MGRHRQLFENVRKRPSMYLGPVVTYEVVAAFVHGYDLACEGGLLAGFREWLVVRLGEGSNLAWTALVLDFAFPGASPTDKALRAWPEAERHAIDTLFDLLAEFDEVRSKRDGLREIFLAYEQWKQEQEEQE